MDRQVVEGFFDKLRKVGQFGGDIDDLYASPNSSIVPTLKRVHNLGKSSSWTDIGPVGQREGREIPYPRVPWEKRGAALKTKLLPHQERVVRRIEKQPGLVVAHGLGSGKTLSSIAAAVKLQPDRTQVLVPASLQANYKKEIKKHVRGGLPRVEIGSLQGAVARGEVPKSDLLVVDEAHRGRNPQSKTYQMVRGAKAGKRLMLTASPTYNRPADVAALVNMAAGDQILPTGTEFSKKYVAQPPKGIWGLLPFTRKRPELKSKQQLGRTLGKWVDYHEAGGKGFPSVKEERHAVKMTPYQTKLHDAAWNRLSLLSKLRLRRGLPPDKKDLPKINAFQSQTRQISSSESAYRRDGASEASPKIQKAVGLFSNALDKNKDHRALVYSNYLKNLDDYSDVLKEKQIPHAIFSGKQKMQERKQMVEDYNKGKLKALLVSSAGGEGLDLKGTRQVQVLEPHWNVEKLKQVEGRAIRRGSHEHLPTKDQNVVLQRFESYPRGGLFRRRRGVEQVLGDMADNKERLNQELTGLLREKRAMPLDQIMRSSDLGAMREKTATTILKPEYLAWKKRREQELGRPMTLREKDDELYSSKIPPWEKTAYELQGHKDFQGLPIAIENRKGSVRKGKDADGNEWRTKMKLPYGYIKGTKGADGEEVDTYVGPDKEAPDAYVVHQRDKETGKYDEDKVMLGFRSKSDAKKAFLAHYDSPQFLGPISRVSMDRLRELVRVKRKLVKISSVVPLQPQPVQPSQDPGRIYRFLRKAGPGIGGAIGLGVGSLIGARRGKLLQGALAGLGSGATLGWIPDMAHGVVSGARELR